MEHNSNRLLKITGLVGALAVVLGAFAAHGLKQHLNDNQIDTFKTGSLYHYVHALAMFVIAIDNKESPLLQRCFYLFLTGIILFSGSLYRLSTKHLYGGDSWNFVGPLTPIGGVFFMLGWLNLVFITKR
ncbi:MAG: DUF423 domain-containing protein [Saprospiraceae bacterium]